MQDILINFPFNFASLRKVGQTSAQLYVETCPPFIWAGKNEYGRVEIWLDGWWTGKQMKEQKTSSKTIDIVSYTLKVSEKGVTCVFVVHFRSSDTFKTL